jgi:hypothetical protein
VEHPEGRRRSCRLSRQRRPCPPQPELIGALQ